MFCVRCRNKAMRWSWREAHWLRAHAAPPKAQNFVPSIHMTRTQETQRSWVAEKLLPVLLIIKALFEICTISRLR